MMSVEKKLFPLGPYRISFHVPLDLNGKPYIQYYHPDRGRLRIYRGLGKPDTYEGRVRLAHRTAVAFAETFEPPRSIENQIWDHMQEKRKDWAPKTYIQYASKFRKFLRWRQDREVTEELIIEYFDFLDRTVGKGTRNDHLAILRQLFKAVTKEDYFGPIRKLRHHAKTKRHYQLYQLSQIKVHLNQHDPMMLFYCQCIFFCLIRPGELVNLQAFHFEIEDERVFIPAHIGKSRRDDYVKIPSKFLPYVERYIMKFRPNEYPFHNIKSKSKPISYNRMSERYRQHMDDLGFDHQFTLYGWKNSGVIALWKRKVKPQYIQIHCRHTSIEITMRYLSNLGCEDLGELPDVYPDF